MVALMFGRFRNQALALVDLPGALGRELGYATEQMPRTSCKWFVPLPAVR